MCRGFILNGLLGLNPVFQMLPSENALMEELDRMINTPIDMLGRFIRLPVFFTSFKWLSRKLDLWVVLFFAVEEDVVEAEDVVSPTEAVVPFSL